MNNKRCRDCYYGNVCSSRGICKDFFPITKEAEDELIFEFIEHNREKFRLDWDTYIHESQD